MIYKVLFQEQPGEVPVRERTKSIYIDAENVREVRKKLADRKLNIEHIVELTDEHLEYEKQAEKFKVENL